MGSHEITEAEVRELFAFLRTVTRPVMADARRRIQERVGNDPIRVDYVTVRQLVGKRLGTVAAATDPTARGRTPWWRPSAPPRP